MAMADNKLLARVHKESIPPVITVGKVRKGS